jgi:hypothetical protein
MLDDMRGGGGGGGDGDGFGYFMDRPMHYILDGQTIKLCTNFLAWARWYEITANRRVASTRVRGIWISTVFLGLDSAISGPPILFETGFFVGDGMADCWRSSTWVEAVGTHKMAKRMAHMARSGRALARQHEPFRAYVRERFGCEPVGEKTI